MATRKNDNLSEAVTELDQLIREGQAAIARRKLGALTKRKIPRHSALALASLARRAGVAGTALKLLNPIVRPPPKVRVIATDSEKAEYAASLTRVGAVDEALGILRALDAGESPEALLFEAFAVMTQWRYSEAIPLLVRYIASPKVGEYQRLVGQVNLAASLVFERRHSEARALLTVLRKETEARRFPLLLGNSLELSAQQALFQEKWSAADRFLAQSENVLRSAGGLDELFVRKWKAVSLLLQTKNRSAQAALSAVREEAKARRHWETVRECDLFEATALLDEKKAVHLYFGTPYESYRNRILASFQGKLALPALYDWELLAGSGQRIVDLFSENDAGAGFKAGHLLQRLLLDLASDFYRPARVASIFAHLYPTEFFNPTSSPTRVHQLIKRLKQWMRKQRFPLAIEEEKGTYRLRPQAPVVMVIPSSVGLQRADHLLARLSKRFQEAPFSASEAAVCLGLTRRHTSRVLTEAIAEGKCLVSGRASLIRYRLSKS